MVAKKETKDLTVEERLKYLYQLQKTLSAIDEKRALRGELPLEVQDLEDEIAGLTTRIGKIQDEIDEFLKAVSQNQNEIKEKEASLERYRQQLEEVRNNREYDALSKAIDFQTGEVVGAKKKISEAQTEVEAKRKSMEDAKAQREEKQKDLEQKRSELNEIMTETKEEEDKLKAKAQEIEAKIEPRLLASFKRIRHNARNGLGIVYVQRGACGGCFNKIPPQRQLDIKMHKKIIVCEYCGRILIDPELAGEKVEQKEEKPKRKRAIKKAPKKDDAAEE